MKYRGPMYRQFDLSHGSTTLRTWLEDDPRLKEGVLVSLRKGDDAYSEWLWTITRRFSILQNMPPEQRWQVGGLS